MAPELESFPPTDKLKRRRPKKKNRALRLIGLLILLLCFSATAYAGYVYYKFDQALNKTSSGNVLDDTESAGKIQRPIALLMMGMDSREETGSLNTDVVMVAVLNPDTKAVTVVSIPRDTYIHLEGYPKGKANSFYSRGERKENMDGPSFAKEVFSRYLDVSIDHFVTVDFESFRKTIDTLGGIDIYVDQDMCYRDNADGTNINLTEGQQVLDGKNALDFVRYRKSEGQGCPDSNDLERNNRQQLVVTAMVDQLKSFNGFLKVGEILDIAGDHVRTDLTQSQMKSLFITFVGTGSEQIHLTSIKGEWRSPYIRVSETELEEVKKMIRGTWDGVVLPKKVTADGTGEEASADRAQSN
jgi:LCP family protein required for cell wall assembly